MPAVFAIDSLSRILPRLGDEFPVRRDQPTVSGFDADLRCIRRDWVFGVFKDVFNFFEMPLFAFGIPLLVDTFDNRTEQIVFGLGLVLPFNDASRWKL